MKCFMGRETSHGYVPCGQCINCRINTGRKWTARILCEWIAHYAETGINGSFCTLTYNEDSLRKTVEGVPTLKKKELFYWLETCRRKFGPFRYYAVGEYGDLSQRPHYHLALFPRSDRQVSRILESWKAGFTSSAEMAPARAAYLARYTTKKLTSDTDERLERDMEPEFRCSSRDPGLGAPFIPALVRSYRREPYATEIAKRGDVFRSVRISGKIYPLDGFMLGKLRKEFGIPLTHTGRIDACPDYLEYFEVDEAERCFDTAQFYEDQHAQNQKAKRINRCAI